MERRIQQFTLYVELEDNCGAVLSKSKVVIPVTASDMDDATVVKLMSAFTEKLPSELP